MTENDDKRPGVSVDREAGERFDYLVEVGREMFAGTGLVDPAKEITRQDLQTIADFHRKVSPENPEHPYRTDKKTPEELQAMREMGLIADPAYNKGWESPGGPAKHIELATQAAEIIVKELQSHLKGEAEAGSEWAVVLEQIRQIDPYHAAAAAAFHDDGRFVTHTYFTNELIGAALLRKMGIREDIIRVLPNERVMLLPDKESMADQIRNLPAEAVIVRIADEHGRRNGKSNELYQKRHCTKESLLAWGKGYSAKPLSGRPSDRRMHQTMPRHLENEMRYSDALDTWTRNVSALSLTEITDRLNSELAPTLRQIPTT